MLNLCEHVVFVTDFTAAIQLQARPDDGKDLNGTEALAESSTEPRVQMSMSAGPKCLTQCSEKQHAQNTDKMCTMVGTLGCFEPLRLRGTHLVVVAD